MLWNYLPGKLNALLSMIPASFASNPSSHFSTIIDWKYGLNYACFETQDGQTPDGKCELSNFKVNVKRKLIT